MFPCSGYGYGFWWIFPIIIIAMMAICFFMMRGRMGSKMCRPGFRSTGGRDEDASESALDILNKRYARGEINKEEYDEKIRGISQGK
ncbi:MAG: SHOCT domain-containing protein [Thermodesulfovibrionales bacterium]|jgi:putative membrane protein